MKILVINSGSSSIRSKLFEMKKNKLEAIFGCFIDAIGQKHASAIYFARAQKSKQKTKIPSHGRALEITIDILLKSKIISSHDEIKIIGHRVVHGGQAFKKTQKIDKNFLEKIKKTKNLAPLHNPANILGIENCAKILPKSTQFAIFDTAFHSQIPPRAFLYGLPYDFYKKFGIRKYGFHGISVSHVAKNAKKILKKLKKPYRKIIICHLGNGCSITAVKNGKSIDTSMGFTPLEGVIMGTRCGDIDPAIPLILQKKLKKTPEEMEKILNHDSGLLGISGLSSDMRPLLKEFKKNGSRSNLAINMFCYKIAKTIAASSVPLNGIDSIVFTAGIGENSHLIRSLICDQLKHFKIKLNKKSNLENKTLLSTKNSEITTLALPTDEELEIAFECVNKIK